MKDIRSGLTSSSPRDITAVGDRVFFSARDGSRGRELWVTDGTAAGTRRVKDIRPGAKGSSPKQLTAVGSTLFFTADDGVHGRELWKIDGASTGTRLVTNINKPNKWIDDVGAFDAETTGELTSFRGRLFFAPLIIQVGKYDGHVFSEVWVSDGTESGTERFYGWDARLGDYDPILWPRELTRVGARLYFRGGDHDLWRSDGSSAGVGPAFPGRLYLTVNGSVRSFQDGALSGPYAGLSKAQHLTDVGGALMFSAADGAHGKELWAIVEGD